MRQIAFIMAPKVQLATGAVPKSKCRKLRPSLDVASSSTQAHSLLTLARWIQLPKPRGVQIGRGPRVRAKLRQEINVLCNLVINSTSAFLRVRFWEYREGDPKTAVLN